MTRYGGYSRTAERAQPANARADREKFEEEVLAAVRALGGGTDAASPTPTGGWPIKLDSIVGRLELTTRVHLGKKAPALYGLAGAATQRLKRAGKLKYVPGRGCGWMIANPTNKSQLVKANSGKTEEES